MPIHVKAAAPTRPWLQVAGVLAALCLIYTALYSLGLFNTITAQQEHWLLLRPKTTVDCVLLQWSALGSVPVMLLFTGLLGLFCWRLGYGRRILLALPLLFLLGVGTESIGKQLFALPIASTLLSGMTALRCPQWSHHPHSISQQVLVALGVWWQAPQLQRGQVDWAQTVASMPLSFEHTTYEHSYPSGHAMRWFFIGFIAFWLLHWHMHSCLLRPALMVLALLIGIGGGLMMFYLGVHNLTDVIAGDLVGVSLACCVLGLLKRDHARRAEHRSTGGGEGRRGRVTSNHEQSNST
jgi:membrane-associated phospholipid phosphatase